MFNPITPTSIIRPRLRLIFAACAIISSVLADAVITTPSAPTFSVRSITVFTVSVPSPGFIAMMPLLRAMLILLGSRSIPITRQPFASKSSAVMSPISPRPTTTMVSPRVGLQRRMPCRPMEPMTVKVACSSVTLSGMCATRFLGTHTYSA